MPPIRKGTVRGDKAALHAENKAIYLPAISESFARQVWQNGKTTASGLTLRELDFLDPQQGLFYYPFALYSAGQSDTGRATINDDIVSKRDRSNTIMLGDSGGYQVSTDADYFTPAIVRQNMRWMERIADYSMVLDFPTGGIGSGTMAPHIPRLIAEGHDLDAMNAINRMGLDYNACLVQTKLNNDDFVQNHAPGATRFLNVLQGRSEKESRYWYKQVRHYQFSGWAFAGHHQNRFSLLLARLIDLWDDGTLADCEWLHVLGISTLSICVLLTAVQRQVRQYANPNFQISFDSASPFRMAANRQILTGYTLDRHGWSFQAVKRAQIDPSNPGRLLRDVMLDDLGTDDDRQRHLADTAISASITVGDIIDTTGKMTPMGDYLVMNHNVEATLDGLEAAHNAMFDPPQVRDPLAVPLKEKTIAAMIELIFQDRSNARQNIRDWASRLDALRSTV